MLLLTRMLGTSEVSSPECARQLGFLIYSAGEVKTSNCHVQRVRR